VFAFWAAKELLVYRYHTLYQPILSHLKSCLHHCLSSSSEVSRCSEKSKIFCATSEY